MKTIKLQLAGIFVIALLASCVSKKEFQALEEEKAGLEERLQTTMNEKDAVQAQLDETSSQLQDKNRQLGGLESDLASSQAKASDLEGEVSDLKSQNKQLWDQMSSLSVISAQGAESIQKSIESIASQSEYIKELTKDIRNKDSTNLVLVMNLKRSLADINDEDVQVEVRGGVVYVSISDQMLFRSGSARISREADVVLGKVASVLNDHSNIAVMVEGHTDDKSINTGCINDNWDLSVKRATSVVRALTDKHGVAPERLTAAGRSFYVPKSTNETKEGRKLNRRTEIVITPAVDEYFKLSEPAAGQ